MKIMIILKFFSSMSLARSTADSNSNGKQDITIPLVIGQKIA